MFLTVRSIILLMFGSLLLLRPVSSFFLRTHFHPPGWGYTVFVSDRVDPDEFVFRGARIVELGERNQDFKDAYDRDYERAKQKIKAIDAFIDRSNWMCVIAGLLLIFAAIPLDEFPKRKRKRVDEADGIL